MGWKGMRCLVTEAREECALRGRVPVSVTRKPWRSRSGGMVEKAILELNSVMTSLSQDVEGVDVS
jgi:hypothetical protein